MLKAYRDRLSELTAGTQITQLEVAASFAITKFNQCKQQARGDLTDLSKAYVEARDELSAFRITHNLARPARNPSGRWTTIGLLFVMIALESVMNGLFFAKGSETGLVGGVGTAFGISLTNVLFCFFLGLVPARFINWRGWVLRTLATLATSAGLAAISFVHLFAGHLRDATTAISEAKAFEVATAKMFATPWALADISSWYLFGLGMLFGLVSFWKGYRHDDPYPHFGETYRRERAAAERYNVEHHALFDDLEEVRDDTLKQIEDGIANIPQYVSKSHQVRAARSALIEKFRAYEQMIVQVANRLLTTYRDANRKRRKPLPQSRLRRQLVMPPWPMRWVCLSLLVPSIASTETWSGAAHVVDGDTIIVDQTGSGSIDAFETGQACIRHGPRFMRLGIYPSTN